MSFDAPKKSSWLLGRNKQYFLLAPGVLWMMLFLVVPLGMMVYVSFWTQTTFAIHSDLTLKSWQTFFASETYFGALDHTDYTACCLRDPVLDLFFNPSFGVEADAGKGGCG